MWHGGNISGFVSQITRYPNENLFIVVLSNVLSGADRSQVRAMSVELAAIAFGEKYELPRKHTETKIDPATLDSYVGEYSGFKHESYVDAKRMGLFGYSRGAIAASLLAVSLNDVRAAVFGGGIYDFKKAYDEIKDEGIRKNMEQETGMKEEAIRQRSSVFQMKKLSCPVLILHGEKDENAPTSQAFLLRDRLAALNKTFEIKIFPDKGHGLDMQEVFSNSVDFFKRKLMTLKISTSERKKEQLGSVIDEVEKQP